MMNSDCGRQASLNDVEICCVCVCVFVDRDAMQK